MSEQDDAARVNDAILDPVPTMPDAPDTIVDLMRGLHEDNDEGGVWHTRAEIRELNGEDEEYLASIENKKDLMYSEYMSALLSRTVLRVGTIEVNNNIKIIDKLILGDRDLLYLQIMKVTYGETRLIKMPCVHCSQVNDVTLELDNDFPITYPDFDVREGVRVETSKGTITLRLPNGEDTVAVQKDSKSDAQMNTAMLARCASWPEGQAPADPMKWARTLGLGDRKKLVNALLDIEIGPKLGEVETQCASCGKDMPILLDWVSLLLG
jgi:hypothetical protein